MKYSIVFPGQGSQSLGMLSDLNSNFSVVNEVFQEASDSISVDLWKILNEDQEALSFTLERMSRKEKMTLYLQLLMEKSNLRKKESSIVNMSRFKLPNCQI